MGANVESDCSASTAARSRSTRAFIVPFLLIKESLSFYLIRINEVGYQNRPMFLPVISRGLNGNGDCLHEFLWRKIIEGRLDDLAIVSPPFLDFRFDGREV